MRIALGLAASALSATIEKRVFKRPRCKFTQFQSPLFLAPFFPVEYNNLWNIFVVEYHN